MDSPRSIKEQDTDQQELSLILAQKEQVEATLAVTLAELQESKRKLEEAHQQINLLKQEPLSQRELAESAPAPPTKLSLVDSAFQYYQEATREIPLQKQATLQISQEPCSICLSDEPLHPLDSCKHSFCATCLQEYFTSAVAQLDLPIKCPDRNCNEHVNHDDVEKFLLPPDYEKFAKFMMKLERPELRDCPNCGTLNQPQEQDSNKIVCTKCNEVYCLIHSNAHPPFISCYQYEKSIRKKDKKNNKALKQTRRCPKCGIFTERTEGCPMMTCSQCDSKWCYLCGGFVKGNSEAGYHCPDCGASAFRHKHEPSCRSCLLGLLCLPCWGTCGLLYSMLCGPICCCLAACDPNSSFAEAYQLCCCPFDIVKDWFWCPCCYTDHNKLYEKRSEKMWGKELQDVPFESPPFDPKKKT